MTPQRDPDEIVKTSFCDHALCVGTTLVLALLFIGIMNLTGLSDTSLVNVTPDMQTVQQILVSLPDQMR